MTSLSQSLKGNVSASRACLLVAIAAYASLVGTAALTRVPINDEGWYGQPAFRLAVGQSMGTPALENSGIRRFQGLQDHTYWIMPLFIVAQAGVYKMLGAGLLQMRLLSAFWGLVLIVSWYVITKKLLRDQRIATLTAALMAVDFQLIAVCATGRSDAMCAALGSAGLAVYLTLRKRSLGSALLLSQSLVAASGLTHPYGVYYFLALLYLVLYFDRQSLTWRSAAAALSPYLVGAVLWGSYILKAPADFAAQFGNNASERSWVVKHPMQALTAEVGRYSNAYGLAPGATTGRRFEALVLFTYAAGIAAVLLTHALRRDSALRPLRTLSALFFLDVTFLEGAKQAWYLVHLIPCLAALLAVVVVYWWNASAQSRKALLAGVLGFALLNIGITAGLSHRGAYRGHYVRLVDFLRRQAPVPARVMGGAELGFGLGFDNVKDDYKLGFYSGWRPSWIVIGDGYRAQFELLRQRRPEIWRYVRHRLDDEYVKTFDDGYYAVYTLPPLPRAESLSKPPARDFLVTTFAAAGRSH